MKKIAFLGDTIAEGNTFGIQRFAYEILRELDHLSWGKLEISIVVPSNSNLKISFDNIKIVKYGLVRNPFLWRQFCFPDYLKKTGAIGIDLTLGLPYLHCDVVALHDCTYENHPEFFVNFKEKFKRRSYLFRARHLVNNSKKIITVSNNSKKELIEFYKIETNKIDVIYNAWQHFERIIADYSVFEDLKISEKDRYFFSLGSGLRHKNLSWVIHAAKQNPNYKFIITGTDRFSNYLNDLCVDKINNVIYTGYICDEKVKALMQECIAFIHPAFNEGFGIPPLEALSCGANIIISNSSCLPEIYGKSAIYINPYNYYNINMDEIMKQQVPNEEKKRVLDKYSWKASAKKILTLCEEI